MKNDQPDFRDNRDASRRRVLIVSYHFPPIVSAGVYRVVGLSRRLLEHGWEVTVLTVGQNHTDRTAPETLRLIPEGLDVIRADAIDIAAPLFRRPDLNQPRDIAGAASGGRYGIAMRIANGARSMLAAPFVFPDRRAGWSIPMMRSMRRFLKRHPGSVVLSSSPPHSSQSAIAVLRKSMYFPWVADFRDPWTCPLRMRVSPLSLRLHRSLETSVLRSADHIIVNTPGNKDALLGQYPFIDPATTTTVTNAYDPYHSEAPYPESIADGDLSYFGEIYANGLDRYLDGLRVLRDRGERIPSLDVYGLIDHQVRRRIDELGFADCVRLRGMLPYGQSLGMMRHARSLLLVVSGDDRWKATVPSKLYPYLFANRPILAIGPDGDATRVVADSGAGTIITSDSPDIIADGMHSFLMTQHENKIQLEESRIQRYHIDYTGRQVSEILETVRRC